MAIEAFTGGIVTADVIIDMINAPENALLLQHDAHQEYDKQFAWGIEALSESDGTVSPILVRNSLLFTSNRSGTIPVSCAQEPLAH